jgi:hypothetical protein
MSAAGVARLAPVGLGLAMAIGIVGTSAHRDAPLWPVWASLAVALTTAAGAIFVYGFDRWTELSTLLLSRTVRLRDVNAPAAAGVAIALLGVLGSVLLSALLSRPTGSSWRGAALVVIAIFGGVPAAGVMFGVRAGRAGLRPCRHSLPASRTGLCDELSPLDNADEASVILSLADDRHKLEQLLGVTAASSRSSTCKSPRRVLII